MRNRRRMTFRPSKQMMAFSRVFAGIFAAIALGFVAIGVTQLLPTAGIFGLVWTLMALCFAGVGIYGACNKKGLYFQYEFQIDEESDEPEAPSPARNGAEERLAELQRLYDQRLITQAEYEEKRKDILKDL